MSYLGFNNQTADVKKIDNISSSFNGVLTTFNLTSSGIQLAPGRAEVCLISLGGVIQEPNTDFSIVGNTIVFSVAPGTGESFFGVSLGKAFNIPTASDADKANLKTYFDTVYQAILVSGTNVKTINGSSVLGTGNITTGDVTLTGSQTLTNKTLTGYTETVYTLTGTDISIANGTVQTKTLTANTTFTKTIADGQSVVLMLNPATYTTTWPTVSWIRSDGTGAAPTLKANVMNTIVLWQVGGVLYGNWIGSM